LFGDKLPHLDGRVGSAHDRVGDGIAGLAQLLGGVVCDILALAERLPRGTCLARGGIAGFLNLTESHSPARCLLQGGTAFC
jgi:hypothetical protein